MAKSLLRWVPLLLLSVMVVASIITGSEAATLEGCYRLYYENLGFGSLKYQTWEFYAIWLDGTGTVWKCFWDPLQVYVDCEDIGLWVFEGGVLLMQFVENSATWSPFGAPGAVFAGSSKQGFWANTRDPETQETLLFPGVWYLKKSKDKDVDCPGH